MLLSGLWDDTSSNLVVATTTRDLETRLNAIAKEMGLLHRFQYMNYANPSQDPIKSYGWDNVRLLREVSREYDPRGVFQEQVNGGFKLFR